MKLAKNERAMRARSARKYAMTASSVGMCSASTATRFVTGFTPPLASVAAIMARSTALTLTEH